MVDFFMTQKETSYEEFFGNIECSLSSDTKLIRGDQFPTIKVHIKYKGNKPIKISWDNNFGHVLWEGNFVLVTKSDTNSYDTSDLKFVTSNVYPPREVIEIKKGDNIVSILDFSKLPIFLEASQLILGKKFSLVLCARNEDKTQPLKPISNELVFNKD